MAERVASGEIHIELDDEAEAGLRRLEAQFKAAMAAIDREKATVTIDADLKRLDRELKEAEAKVKEYQKRIDAADNARSKSSLARYKREADAQAAAARKALTAKRQEIDAVKETNRQYELTEKRIGLVSRREEARARILAANARRRKADLREEQREEDRLLRIQEKAATVAQRRQAAHDREAVQVPKLQRRYIELAQSLERLDNARRKARGDARAEQIVGIKQADVVNDMRILKQRLEAAGSPIDLDVNLEPGRDTGTRLRHWFARNQGGAITLATAAGTSIGAHLGNGMVARFRQVADKGLGQALRDAGGRAVHAGGSALLRGTSRLGNLLSNIGDMTVRLGPFTAQIRQALVATSLLAPILLDLTGAFGALIGVTGSAVLGVGALGAGLLGGLIPGLIGTVTVVKPVIDSFKQASTLAQAYHKAVLEGNTDLAKKKLEAYNSVLKGVDKSTRDAIMSSSGLAQRWGELTAPARAGVFRVIGAGLKFANDNLQTFATGTNAFVRATSGGLARLLQGLDVGALAGSMRNVNAAMGPVIDGFANLLNYILRVGNVASSTFPGFARQFRDWSQGVLDGTNNVDKFRAGIMETIDSLRAVGRFTQASGRFLATFFGGGVESGQRFLDVMTAAVNKWTTGFKTPQGQASLQAFFNEAVSGARSFYNALAPVVSSFVRWAAEIAPFARAFFDAAGGVASFVAELLKVTGLRGPLTAIATTLGTLWGIGKIGAATRALAGFSAALLGVKRAQEGVAAASAVAGVAGAAGGLGAGAAGAGAAAGAISKVGKEAEVAAKKGGLLRRILTFGGAGAATRFINPWIAGAVALGVGLSMLKSRGEKARDAFFDNIKAARSARDAYVANGSALSDLSSAHQRAAIAVRQARENLRSAKKGTDEYRLGLLDLRDAERAEQSSAGDLRTARDEYTGAMDKSVAADQKALRIYDKRHASEMERLRDIVKNSQQEGMRQQKLQELNNLEEKRNRITSRLNASLNQQAASQVNLRRQLAGLPALTGAAEQALGKLARTMGGKKLSQTIGVKFQGAGDASKVAKSAASALKSGVPTKLVTKIVADSKNAEDAVRKINAIKLAAKRLHISEQGGGEVLGRLAGIAGKKLGAKVQQLRENGGAGVLARIGSIIAKRLGNKSTRLSAVDQASAIIGRVRGAIASLPASRTTTLTVNHVENYVTRGHKSGPLRGTGATGGIFSYAFGGTPDQRMIDRAAKRADMLGQPRGTRGEKVTRPKYLVAEEPAHPEYVISSNPRYRKRNQELVRQAANATGVQSLATGGYGGTFTGGAFNPTATLKPKSKFKKSKKNKGVKKAAKANRGWASYIDGLQTQQGDWEREVSIRESQLSEPEDTIIEGPKKKIKDPTTGEDIEVKTYLPNTGPIEEYKKQIRYVMEAFDQLIKIIFELVRAIPQAISAAQNEYTERGSAITALNGYITKEKAKLAKADKDDKPKHQKRIEKWKKERDGHKEERKGLKEAQDALVRDRVDAGFDFREAVIARGKYQTEHDEISPKADASAAEATKAEDPTQNGSGGSGGTGLSYGEQAAATDTEKANILKEFGSNFIPAAGGGGSTASATMATALGASGAGGITADLRNAIGGAITSATTQTASAAAAAVTSSSPTVVGGGGGTAAAAPTVGTSTNVTVNNTFATVPPDPHTWAAGVEFELGAIV